MMRRVLFLFLVLAATPLAAQNTDAAKQALIEAIVEEYAANTDNSTDQNDLSDALYALAEQALDLNTATANDLAQLIFLSPAQVERLLAARQRYGPFRSLFELLYIEGFARADVERLQHFVALPEAAPKAFAWRRSLPYAKHQWLLRWQRVAETAKGYTPATDRYLAEHPNSRYLGSPDKLYARYSYRLARKLTAGFTAEKDPGEPFLNESTTRGFDFVSAHLQVDDLGPLRRLVLGDFQANFGQGLVLWNGFAGGKSSFVLQTAKAEPGIARSASAAEANYLRGLATRWRWHRLFVHLVASYRAADASTSTPDSTSASTEWTSISTTGLHRTPSELARRGQLHEQTLALNLLWKGQNWALGTTGLAYRLSAGQQAPEQLYQLFQATPQQGHNYSVDYRYHTGALQLWGETALDAHQHLALVHGLGWQANKHLAVVLHHRYFGPQYLARYANAFAEGSRVQNEEGLYLGIELTPRPRWRAAAYADVFRYPWLSFGAAAPQRGTEYFAEVAYRPTRRTTWLLRYRAEQKLENAAADSPLPMPVPRLRSSWRSQLDWHPIESLALKSRIETAYYQKERTATWGYLLAQDIAYQLARPALSLHARFALYQTDYNTRIYAYENDLPYTFGVPAHQGQGWRAYLMMAYPIGPKAKLWIRWSRWYLMQAESYGSGLDELDQNHKTEIKLMLRLQL